MRRYDGVHLVCYGTPDAEGEQRRPQAHDFEPPPVDAFERAVDGGTARFKTAPAAPEKMPEGRIQYVEQLTPEHVWRPADVDPLRLEDVVLVGDHSLATA